MTSETSITEKESSCSFCGKSQFKVKKLIIGPGVHICNDCVSLCQTVIAESPIQDENREIVELSPSMIVDELNKHVIGQEDAKKILSVAAYNHNIMSNSEKPEEFSKSNVLLLGPSGSGKTLLCQILSKILHIPFSISDATSLTETGYVGDDVDTIITSLIEQANGDVELAEKGIIYIDEIDKIAAKPIGTRDISGGSVQAALLKIIEGTVMYAPPTFNKGGSASSPSTKVKFDTSKLLFIFGGSFQGLDKIISKRVSKAGIGFKSNVTSKDIDSDAMLSQVSTLDLIEFGMVREFIGRISFTAALNELTEKELISILTETENSLTSQFKSIFAKKGVSLIFDKKALGKIASKAIGENTGARGLRSILNDILINPMFDIPDSTNIESVIISEEVVEGTAAALYTKKAKVAETS
jgi:ATP-dependent Clp protease ATP-binding subunit ClpX